MYLRPAREARGGSIECTVTVIPHFSTLAIKFVDDILSLGARCITLVRTTSSHSCASNEGTGTSIQSRAFKPRVWRAGSTSRLRYRWRPPCEVRKSIGVTGPADSIDKQIRLFISCYN